MIAMEPHTRPLVLLHKSSECATFAIAPSAISNKQTMDIDRIRLRFSQVLGLSHNRSVAKKDMDEDGDDDSAYGSNSGQSSPDDSPVSRSNPPSPVDSKFGSSKSDELPNRPANPFRCRSMSESCNGLPLKGILKRRGPVLRSLSQCDEETLPSQMVNEMSESPSLQSSNDGLDHNISESGEDEDNGGRDRSQSNSSVKKTVRFNDRVQETLFRPNSSILGQRKKNQRKQQRKRKRTNSGDSQTGESEHENDQDVEIEEMESKEEVVDQTKVATPNKQSNTKSSNRKKSEPANQGAVVLEDKRYDGFVVGMEKKARQVNHRRHSSGDSGLGDDEGDGEVFAKPVPKGGKNRRRRTVSCGDSGTEE